MLKKLMLLLAVGLGGLICPAAAQDLEEVYQESIDFDDFEVYRPYVFSLGPKVDFNYALAGDPEGMKVDMKGGAGFNAGLAANVRFLRPAGRPIGTERLGVQLEVSYSMRNLNNNVHNITLNSIEIPVLFQWYFIPQLALEVGPTFTHAFSSSPKEWDYNGMIYQTNKFKAGDVMVTFGLNCKLPSGFMAELRYNLGNSNIADNFRTKVSTISVGIGWLFNVIK